MMDTVRYECTDGIAEIMLARPPVNALTPEMVDGVVAALRRAAADDRARAVVLGSGVADRFCAGLNLNAFHQAPLERIHALLETLYVQMTDAQFNLGKPSIAAVGGPARGGGVTLAISCDMIVAGRSASFGYPEIEVGLLPAIHYAHLPRIVGRHRAFDLLFTGRSFDVSEAQALGLVSRVVDDDAVLREARALARELAGKSPAVMKMARHAFLSAIDTDYRRSVASAVANFCTVAATDESREGIAAFIEKRTPSWPSARD